MSRISVLTTALGTGLLASMLLVPPATAAKPVPRADLVTQQVALDRPRVAPGGSLQVRHLVANRGQRKAQRTLTRFYLSTDPALSRQARAASRTNPRTSPYDILLDGGQETAAVRPRKRTRAVSTVVTVPAGTRPGEYRLLACADERGRVKERKEANNCTAAGTPVTVLAPAGPVTPPPVDDIQRSLQQFADVYRWPDDESGTLQQMTPFCNAIRPTRPMDLGAALASARAFLLDRTGNDAVARVDASPHAATADQTQELAAAAVAKGSPGLALAALLRAHLLEPGNGTHLVNAATLSVGVGLPNEALALLDAAAVRTFGLPAMGVSQQAIALVVRGNALVQLGRDDEARTAYLDAQQREPLLSEADTGLATLAACAGEEEKAQRLLRRSRQRSETPREDPTGPVPDIDTSHGRETALRQLPQADSPQQLVKLKSVYDEINQGFVAEIDGHNAESDELAARIRIADEERTRAEKRRRAGIVRLVDFAHEEPEIAALAQAYNDAIDDAREVTEGFFGEGTGEGTWTYKEILDVYAEPCEGVQPEGAHRACLKYEINRLCRPAMISAHNNWRAKMSRAQQAGDAYLAALSRRESAYAANIADPDTHRRVLIGIERHERTIYAGLVGQAIGWSAYVHLVRDDCVEPKDAPNLTAPDPAGAVAEDPCTKGVRSFDIVVPIEPVTIKVNCDKIQVGIAGGDALPLLVGFAEVTYDLRAGKVTFFGGAQGSGKVVGVAELAFKSGIYVTADRTGTVDAGWRVGPSGSVGYGSVESGVFNEEIDISFVNALRGTD